MFYPKKITPNNINCLKGQFFRDNSHRRINTLSEGQVWYYNKSLGKWRLSTLNLWPYFRCRIINSLRDNIRNAEFDGGV